jgi:hypothetical protein
MASFDGAMTVSFDEIFENHKGVYDFTSNQWKPNATNDQKNNTCNALIRDIEQKGYHAWTFANELYKSGEIAQAKLIFRCISRMKWKHECEEGDMAAAFGALAVNDKDISDQFVSVVSGMDLEGGDLHQVGGSLVIDLALLLRMSDVRALNDAIHHYGAAADVPGKFARFMGWANDKVNGLSDCLKSLLGIAGEQTYYDALTNKIAGVYYRSSASAGEFKEAFKTWLMSSPMDALGFMAVAMRYPGAIINTTSAAITTASEALSSTAAVTATFTAEFVSDLWASDAGVMVCVLLYLYERNRDQVDAIGSNVSETIKTKFGELIVTLGNIEANITKRIDDSERYAQFGELRFHLAQVKADLAKSETMLIQENTLKLLAQVVSAKNKLNFEKTQKKINTKIITDLTAELNLALGELHNAEQENAMASADEAAAKDTLNANIVGATFGAKMIPEDRAPAIVGQDMTQGQKRGREEKVGENEGLASKKDSAGNEKAGGKSRSRKLHKKVSKSKRPKKSVHSRKAKGAKRSNKKH